MLQVVSYVNQFFAGLGGEEKANMAVEIRSEAVGSARALQRCLGTSATVVATIIGGDNYVNEERNEALQAIRKGLVQLCPDVVVAGPAFNAGRYGLACAEVCHLANGMGVPAVTAMYPENPGVMSYKRDTIIVPCGEDASSMAAAVEALARLATKLGNRDPLGPAEVDGYLATGLRKLGVRDKPAYFRAVQMLVSKMAGKPFVTELPIESPEIVKPALPISRLARAKIALLTSGGLVPKGNPDRLPGGPANAWFRYPIDQLDSMSPEMWYSVHVGFNTSIVNENPNYVVPLNLMRELERRAGIGGIYPWYLTTSGRGTSVAISKRMGGEMAAILRDDEVDGALLVAT